MLNEEKIFNNSINHNVFIEEIKVNPFIKRSSGSNKGEFRFSNSSKYY